MKEENLVQLAVNSNIVQIKAFLKKSFQTRQKILRGGGFLIQRKKK